MAVLPAWLLLDVAFSDVMSATARADGSGYDLAGTQRLSQPRRLPQIAGYIDRGDSAFPNSIILAGNFQEETGLIEDDTDPATGDDGTPLPPRPSERNRRWEIVEEDGGFTLVIPTREKLAAIIDGQHRLFAFVDVKVSERLDMDLVCSVFLDLPKPYQAQLFATINSTQKAVDKSLTYELFGYNISEETSGYWTPDKLAVLLTRKLGTEENSPLRGRIIVAPQKDRILSDLNNAVDWKVSTAAIAEGIMRLFTSNPKRDSNYLLSPYPKERRELINVYRDKSPLRQAYLLGNDSLIYAAILNYVIACQSLFWKDAKPQSFIIKTVGVQALFDILRDVVSKAFAVHDVSTEFFQQTLAPAASINFGSEEFRKASGSGRVQIRHALRDAIAAS